MRTLFALLLVIAGSAAALACASAQGAPPDSAWHRKGLLVCRQPNAQSGAVLASSSDSAWFVAWSDERVDPAAPDLYAQKRLNDGTLAPGWPATGALVVHATGAQKLVSLANDGAGGLFAVWEDYRFGPAPVVYAQHLSSTGVPVTGWAAAGNRVCSSPGVEHAPQAIADGTGGLIVVWEDSRFGQPQLFMQHLDADGTNATGWPSAGRRLASTSAGEVSAAVTPDGAGGLFLAWSDSRNSGISSIDVYALHVDGGGAPIAGWPAAGLAVCTAAGAQDPPVITLDGAGGIDLAWSDSRGGVPVIYAQRITASGALATGWPVDGLPLSTASGGEFAPGIVADGEGGAIVAWVDARGVDADLYAQHVGGDAVVRWPALDVPVCAAAGDQLAPRLLSDGIGGTLVAWQDARDAPETRVFAQHLDGTGARVPGWPATGRPLADSNLVVEPAALLADGEGGAIVAWSGIEEPDPGTDQDVFAARVLGDGTVPVLATLVSAEARTGAVTLRWWTSSSFPVTIERAASPDGGAAPDWHAVATVVPVAGIVDWVDRAVMPGARAGWRLRTEGDVAGETWLTIPERTLALALASANPATARVSFAVTSPRAAPARLDVFDAAGRRCATRALAVTAGEERVSLDVGDWPPGLYLARFTESDRAITRRFTVAR